jgi:N-succinyl-L-ornithine transcarbamylase
VIESENSLVIPEAANREISCSVVLKRMLEALATGQANKTIN